MDIDDFTKNIVSVVIALIIVGLVAYPVIIGMVDGENATVTDPTLVTIIKVIPIFLVLVVLVAVTYMLYDRKNKLN